jgi:hypothetical protein
MFMVKEISQVGRVLGVFTLVELATVPGVDKELDHPPQGADAA